MSGQGIKAINQLTQDIGHYQIDKIRVVRKPLVNAAQKLGKLVIPNKDDNPDKYFHLYTEISAVSPEGQREVVLIEKNQRVGVKRNVLGGIPEPNEGRNVNLGGKKLSVKEFVENGKIAHERAGVPYEKYRLTCSNCQRFTILNLRGSGLEGGNKEVMDFVVQPVSELLPKWSERIANLVTDTAAWIGEGLDQLRF
jgi:hypothetical protein